MEPENNLHINLFIQLYPPTYTSSQLDWWRRSFGRAFVRSLIACRCLGTSQLTSVLNLPPLCLCPCFGFNHVAEITPRFTEASLNLFCSDLVSLSGKTSTEWESLEPISEKLWRSCIEAAYMITEMSSRQCISGVEMSAIFCVQLSLVEGRPCCPSGEVGNWNWTAFSWVD